jgi:DNA-binding response OmpR family regulator
VVPASRALRPSAHLLELDADSPGIVRAQGREVRLTPMSFRLLEALAERPGQVVTREALYGRLWPGGGPEPQQLDNHRRVLLRRLRPMLGDRAGDVAEVVRGIGFRMTLSSDLIRSPRPA